ncbi:MAG TPA: DoxX family protein [Jatrophihabitans sp.]|nr:DoxX family protein [Jatrophihabitans sp.]
MALIRRLARPMLAATFIYGGLDTLRNPGPKAQLAENTVGPLVNAVPQLSSTEQVVKLDAAVKVVAGTTLALGKFPRLSSAALVASLIPTTYSGHPFWEKKDPAERRQQLVHFLKNTSIVGGLLLAAVDTAGKPSLAWRAQRAPHLLSHAAGDLRRDAELALHEVTDSVRDKLPLQL